MNVSPLYYEDNKSCNLTRSAWIYFIGWNMYLNYEVKDTTILVYYNWYVAEECRKQKRPLYLPFNYRDANFKIVFEEDRML